MEMLGMFLTFSDKQCTIEHPTRDPAPWTKMVVLLDIVVVVVVVVVVVDRVFV